MLIIKYKISLYSKNKVEVKANVPEHQQNWEDWVLNLSSTNTIEFVPANSENSPQMMSHILKGLFLPGSRWDVDPESSVQQRVILAERS